MVSRAADGLRHGNLWDSRAAPPDNAEDYDGDPEEAAPQESQEGRQGRQQGQSEAQQQVGLPGALLGFWWRASPFTSPRSLDRS